MDVLTHNLYEVGGTAGTFASSAAISRFGNNYSYFMSPVFMTLSGATWIWILGIVLQEASCTYSRGGRRSVLYRDQSKEGKQLFLPSRTGVSLVS